MLNSFQHPWCNADVVRAADDGPWTLKRVQGDERVLWPAPLDACRHLAYAAINHISGQSRDIA